MQKLREEIAFLRLNLSWRILRWAVPLLRWRSAEPSLVLVPCDPWTVIGSRGDEAMVYAVLQNFRKRHPNGKITVVTAHENMPADSLRLQDEFGVKFVAAWQMRFILWRIVKVYLSLRPTEVYVIGADCVDGHYSAFTSSVLVMAADLAFRLGIQTCLTAFSWNEQPDVRIVRILRQFARGFDFAVRDQMSYERFKTVGVKSHLSADIAFLLQPAFTDRVKSVIEKMDACRAKGKRVLGFNLNPLVPVDLCRVNEVLKDFSKEQDVAVFLVPHDFRTNGDLRLLKNLSVGELIDEPLSAAELKALVTGVDFLFTSRMHLAIAALGSGKPVAAYSYQGKVEGLYRHFGLPAELVVRASDEEGLCHALDILANDQVALSKRVAEKLGSVMELAQANLDGKEGR